MIDYSDPKWRLKERVDRLVNRGHSKENAEVMVKYVIETKEGPHEQPNQTSR